MGACCSSPVVVGDAAAPADIRAAAQHPGTPRSHQADGISEMVHVLATVRAQQQAGGQHRHHHHHHHPQQQLDSRGVNAYGPTAKQLLRAGSPPQQPGQQQQQQPYGLSPRSYHQLQQLLPTAPLQQLAQGQPQHHSQSPRGKDTHILRSSSLGAHAPAGAHSADATSAEPAAHSLSQLQHLHNASSGGSFVSTPRAAAAAAAATTANSLTQGHASKTPADALSPTQLLAVCAAVVQEDGAFQAAGITPLLLASLCLIESGACPQAKQYREHLGDNAHGLCQVLASTAQWLASSQGFDQRGSCISVKDLEHPKTCVFFAAAYLSVLSHYGGTARSEGFVTRAYHSGPKGVDTAAAHTYLQNYLKAKHWLTEVLRAMAVTVAAAALAAQVQLPAAAAGDAGKAGSAAAGGLGGGEGLTDSQAQSGTDQDSTCVRDAGVAAAVLQGSKSSSSSSGSTRSAAAASPRSSEGGSRQVLVRRGAADLIVALCSDWEDVQQATSKTTAVAAGPGTGAGSLLAHMLPGGWGLSSSRQQQQQGQHARQGSVDASSSDGVLGLVRVAAADVCTAWRRLLSISPCIAQAALAQAAAAASLAPLPVEDWRIGASSPDAPAAAAAAAAPAGEADGGSAAVGRLSTRSWLQRCSPTAPTASATAAAEAAAEAGAQALDAMPCVIHVVGHGETLARIASVCDLAVPDLLAANPEVPTPEAVQHNDCIAVPLPAVFPRLYVVQPGDTLHSIARAHEVPLGRVLAKNPELIDPSRVQPGWVVALPGLKGDSQVALPLDWLTQAPLTADLPQQPAWGHQQQQHAADPWAADAEPPGATQRQQQADGPQQQQAAPPAQQGESAPRQRSKQHRHLHNKPGGNSGLQASAVAADRRSCSQQQQAAALPPVGTGAFLFTVGSSSSHPVVAKPSPAVDGMQQRQPRQQQQQWEAPQGVQAQGRQHKGPGSGGGGGRVALAGHSLGLPRSWTVGTTAGFMQPELA